ncbi:MAG: hypothetical protein Q7W44_07535 [Coriobacteriia bacterium]|nr:hypothetical protein [Coriobacteriia bacterium]
MERHERLVALAWLAAVIVLIAIGWSTLRGHRAIVTNVYPSLGVAEIRDTSDGELYMAEPVSGLTVWAGDEVRYESWTDEMKRITSVTEPAQAR